MDGITYGNSGVAKTTNTTYSFTINNTGNALIPLVANTYTLYIKASNTIGNSTTTTAGVQVYTTTIVPTIDAGNTKSLTSGNLTVSITDASNSSTNGIYYLYSTDNITYGNSGVATTAGNTKYTFTIQNTGNALIPLTANTYTLYIKASNPIGNSTTTTATVQVYTTPLSPTIDASNTQSLTSGNLTVFINDTVNSLTNGIYYLYSTDGITYGNSGVAKTTNTTYTFTINNTGNAQIPLIAKTYTLYIAATNPIGNTISNPATAIESVYTTPSPPTIDQGNTKSITSGNLNVGFTDTFNNGNNQVEYTYFLYDSTAAPLFYV
jgi:archaellum component FlaG (FlaF/FlaG flagellin family)